MGYQGSSGWGFSSPAATRLAYSSVFSQARPQRASWAAFLPETSGMPSMAAVAML